MKLFFKITIISSLMMLISCAEVLNTIGQLELPVKLTEGDVADGLREALKIGTNNSVDLLSTENGFLSDELLKIALPPEATIIIENLALIPGGEKLVGDAVLRLNRAAEDAVTEAGPIFVGAITSMTIADAFNILHGQDNAATTYLKDKTFLQLKELFQPKVVNSLDKVLVGRVSTNESWLFLTKQYNTVANSLVGSVAGLQTIDVSLDEYVTLKALDGLFVKVADEEREIRKYPLARVTPLLKRVFGELDK
jgi:hypothetical protein